MLNRLKNLKIVKNLKTELAPKLRWLMFARDNNKKSSSENSGRGAAVLGVRLSGS